MLGRTTPPELGGVYGGWGVYMFSRGGVFIWVGWVLLLGARSSVWLEHLAHNQVVVGSNPSGPTFYEW